MRWSPALVVWFLIWALALGLLAMGIAGGWAYYMAQVGVEVGLAQLIVVAVTATGILWTIVLAALSGYWRVK